VKLYPDSLIEHDLAEFAGIPSLDVPVEDRDIPLDLAEIFEWKKPYTVKWGDSVSSIALAYGLSMDAIITSNNIKDARRLPAGMELRIPNMDGISYTVKKGDNLSTIAESRKVPLNVVLDANNITSSAISPGQILFIPGARMQKEDLRRAMGELFVYPVKGRRTDSYGYRINPFTNTQQFHAAIDLAAPTGTPVKASREGRVTSIGNNAVYGKFIILSHGGGYETLYAHLNTIVVKQGSRVNQGEKIGEVGSTGRSTGPHLHFAIYKNDRPVNPLDLL
jgi:murein DD-endopeptidase MepM/ murein hydrolase activator NlpD